MLCEGVGKKLPCKVHSIHLDFLKETGNAWKVLFLSDA